MSAAAPTLEKTVIKQISPMLAVADMTETVSFYEEVLGFSAVLESPVYSIVERGGQTVHLQKAESEKVLECVHGHTSFYIEVTGIHEMWEHVKTFKNRYKIRDLFDQHYMMTEFHIEDPNGCLVFVGQRTSK